MSKEAILNSAKSALQSNKLRDAVREYGGEIKHGKDNLIDEYIAMQVANKGIIVESSDLTKDLAQILRDLGSKSNIYAKSAELLIAPLKDEFNLTAYDKSVDEIRDTLFSTDTAIIKADCGIADIGVIGVASSADSPRLASLITKNCIAILERKNIVKSIKDGIAKLRGENLPSNMILIAGPSRTADIELKTVFGVHGPQVVYIILV
ncbi:LutC/YkgG family protein [Helicobacter sp. 23-1045]